MGVKKEYDQADKLLLKAMGKEDLSKKDYFIKTGNKCWVINYCINGGTYYSVFYYSRFIHRRQSVVNPMPFAVIRLVHRPVAVDFERVLCPERVVFNLIDFNLFPGFGLRLWGA